jgi:hypothetical protein
MTDADLIFIYGILFAVLGSVCLTLLIVVITKLQGIEEKLEAQNHT